MKEKDKLTQKIFEMYQQYPFPDIDYKMDYSLPLIRFFVKHAPKGKKNLLEGNKIMEAGCGTGNTIIKLAESCPKGDFLGLDMVTNSLNIARKKADLKNLKQVENELEQDQLTFNRMSIKSPVDGIIVAVDVFEGDLISDRTGIAEIISNERRVIAKISEEDFAKVKLGHRVVVRFLGYGDDLFNGEVIQLLPTNDPETQRFSIFLSVDISKERLTPGLTGEANIIVAERENTLIIPSRALLGDQVYVVKNGKIEIRPVLKGYQGLHNVEVLEGLEEGELVIVEDLDRFKQGNKVKVQ